MRLAVPHVLFRPAPRISPEGKGRGVSVSLFLSLLIYRPRSRFGRLNLPERRANQLGQDCCSNRCCLTFRDAKHRAIGTAASARGPFLLISTRSQQKSSKTCSSLATAALQAALRRRTSWSSFGASSSFEQPLPVPWAAQWCWVPTRMVPTTLPERAAQRKIQW